MFKAVICGDVVILIEPVILRLVPSKLNPADLSALIIDKEPVPAEYPIKIPFVAPNCEAFTPINGLAPSFAKSELSAMTGFILPLVPTLSDQLAYASCASDISVATESKVSPNVSQSDDDGDGCPNEPLAFANQKFISAVESVNSQISILCEDDTY